MTELMKYVETFERRYQSLQRDFEADGHVSAGERAILDTVGAKLAVLREQVARAQTGRGVVTFGSPSIRRVALGPPVDGPRLQDLWALVAEDGSGPLNRSNSKGGAHLNERGHAALETFRAQKRSEDAWRNLYDQVSKMADRSAAGLKQMEAAAAAVGRRSSNRSGAYVREHSEAYIKGQREVEDRVRAIGPLQEALNEAISELNEAGLGKQVTEQTRAVNAAKGAVAKEKANVARAKKRLNGLLGLAIKAVKQDWKGLAEGAAKLIGAELIHAMPTDRLDQLKAKLKQASAQLARTEDELLLAKIETASAGLRGAAKALDDGRRDVLDAMADLRLAQKTAVEALGESKSTAAAAKMIALRGKMLALMDRARSAVEQYQREASPFVKELTSLRQLYKSFPGVVKMSSGIDPKGEYAQAVSATALENAETVDVWRSYVAAQQKSGQVALRRLADTGDGGFLRHFNRVPEVLEAAIRDR